MKGVKANAKCIQKEGKSVTAEKSADEQHRLFK